MIILKIIISSQRIYANGFDVNLPLVYPKVTFPVSRGTPMIAPHVKWDHTDDWFVTYFGTHSVEKSAERKVKISLMDPEFEFMIGHLIDGKQDSLKNISRIKHSLENYPQEDVCSQRQATCF